MSGKSSRSVAKWARGYRGFGDDSWIDEMDKLFAAATSLYRAGQFKAASEAYLALFGVFDLAEDGFHTSWSA